MRKEMYEKKIAELEGENEALRSKILSIREDNKKEIAEALKQRDGLFIGIHDFMNKMYRDLGGIQSGLLKNMSSLNEASIKTREALIQRQAIDLIAHEQEEDEDD